MSTVATGPAAGLPRWAVAGLLPVLNLLAALVVSGLVVALIGESPWEAVRILLWGAFGFEEAIGYIALAALIFGKWRPVPAMLACLLFGFLDAVAIRLQGVELPAVGEVPVQFVQALPYVLTVVLLAGFIGRAVPPKALGLPYVKER